MDLETIFVVFFRWLHVTAAGVAIGGALFMRLILPRGVAPLEPNARQEVLLRCRRAFKIVIHTIILLLIASGIYNVVRLWPQYSQNRALLHGIWGIHLLLALLIFSVSIMLTSGPQPPKAHRTWMAVNLVLLALVVLAGSTLKTARERVTAATSNTSAAQVETD